MDETGATMFAAWRRSRRLRSAIAASFAAAMALAGFSHRADAVPDEVLFALEMGNLGIICQNHPDGTRGLLAELLAPCDFCLMTGLPGSGPGVAGRLRATRRRDLRRMRRRSFVPLLDARTTARLAA